MAFGLNQISKKKQNIRQIVDQDKITFAAKVKKIIYKNEENGFYVMLVSLEKKEKPFDTVFQGVELKGRDVVLVGTSMEVVTKTRAEDVVSIVGTYEINKKTNAVQIAVITLKEELPTSLKAMRLFLSSGKIEGIGPVLADRIVVKFGVNTMDIIANDPDKLELVEGIGSAKKEEIIIGWQKWNAMYKLLSDIQEYEIPDKIALDIYKKYGGASVELIETNPYKLLEINDVDFKLADELSQKVGIGRNESVRIEAGINYTFSEMYNSGSTAYAYGDILDRAVKLLNLERKDVDQVIQEMVKEKQLYEEYVTTIRRVGSNKGKKVKIKCLATKESYIKESNIAKRIMRCINQKDMIDVKYKEALLKQFLKDNDYGLNDSQLSAIKMLINHKVSILTGRPGTGKTHTIKAIINFVHQIDKNHIVNRGKKNKSSSPLEVVLSAPTGHAAKRMKAATGYDSQTIHSLLGADMNNSFEFNAANKLKGDVFIVDESSMIDSALMSALLDAIPETAIILFVGDIDQLPSVGPGKVLEDLLNLPLVGVTRLNTIYRQNKGKDSKIITVSHSIIDGIVPELPSKEEEEDFYFLEEKDNVKALAEIKSIMQDLIKQGVTPYEIQLLTPKREGDLSVRELNKEVRGIVNDTYENNVGDNEFVIGDKVIQLVNNKDHNISNGDVGVVYNVNEEEVVVSFDDKTVTLKKEDLKNLQLAYAKTIHKSQGSEYQYVIIPMIREHAFMWDVKLLYTAITRGSSKVIMVGNKNMFSLAVKQNKQRERITLLPLLLNEYQEAESEDNDVEVVDTMVGVITPKAFTPYNSDTDEEEIVERDCNMDQQGGEIKVEKKAKIMAFGF